MFFSQYTKAEVDRTDSGKKHKSMGCFQPKVFIIKCFFFLDMDFRVSARNWTWLVDLYHFTGIGYNQRTNVDEFNMFCSSLA